METEVLPPQTVEGADKNPPLETTPPAQADAPPQDTVHAKVDGANKVPQVSEPQRRRPSDYYHEREKIHRLEERIKSQDERLEKALSFIDKAQRPDATETKNWTEEDWKRFALNPEAVLSAREKRFLDQIQKMEERLNHWDKTFTQTEQSKNIQEALELLFPKTSPDSNETLEERVANNPEYAARVDHYLKNTALGKLFNVDPREASELMLLKLEKEKPQNPTVLKKGLMGGSARGNPGMGSQRTAPIEEKRAELKRLTAEMDANPKLRFDKDHKSKREAVMRDIERLAK